MTDGGYFDKTGVMKKLIPVIAAVSFLALVGCTTTTTTTPATTTTTTTTKTTPTRNASLDPTIDANRTERMPMNGPR